MPSFDSVVDAYDAARPSYPDEVYDALEPLDGLRVVDAGAGTGIATRGLRARGAAVVALDLGEQMLRRVDGERIVADGARLPLREASVDLVTFAQCWHWLDRHRAGADVARVLRPRGRWAAWWNHARTDGARWFEAYFDLIESRTEGRRWHRDTDWGTTLDAARFESPSFVAVPWVRELSIETWLTEERSRSYIGLVDGGDTVVDDIERILRDEFGDGPVRCRYETWLWQAVVRSV